MTESIQDGWPSAWRNGSSQKILAILVIIITLPYLSCQDLIREHILNTVSSYYNIINAVINIHMYILFMLLTSICFINSF